MRLTIAPVIEDQELGEVFGRVTK
ncbi:conserved hypothetical protein [Cupriavidus necator]|uniref:Uncharacterized protein n=1 Tax=Cupriavidus necator TaxID=106590 RepID=A0A1K0ICU4_CUPNE|nr:conserved hypothetical protein [Cupriavidus necator]